MKFINDKNIYGIVKMLKTTNNSHKALKIKTNKIYESFPVI